MLGLIHLWALIHIAVYAFVSTPLLIFAAHDDLDPQQHVCLSAKLHAINEHLQALKQLLYAEGFVEAEEIKEHEFSSLLIDAVKLGYVDVVKYLIEVAKVELGLPVPRNGNDAATLLVQEGEKAHTELQGKAKLIDLAENCGHSEIVNYLRSLDAC